MDSAALGADAVVSGDGCAHALGAVLREALHVLARVEGCVRQQQGCGLGALTAAAMPADLYAYRKISTRSANSLNTERKEK